MYLEVCVTELFQVFDNALLMKRYFSSRASFGENGHNQKYRIYMFGSLTVLYLIN